MVPGRLWLPGYSTPSDSVVEHRQLERTEVNPGEAISFCHHTHYFEAGSLYWYQSSNYWGRQRDHTVAITRLTRVVGITHGGSVSDKFSLS